MDTRDLSSPVLSWAEDGTPRSGVFGDVYFSVGDGMAESRYVFLDGAGLPQAWQGRDRWTVAETGFGTGLNFLLTWQAWRADPQRCGHLSYCSVEGFPLRQDDLRRALALFPALSGLAEELIRQWPAPVPGVHSLNFDGGRVRLLLLFGPVLPMLSGLMARVDTWFLDGFAPSKNPDMWAAPVLHRVAALSAPGARLATFTAAGQVRRDLQAFGFTVQRRKGFGYKRECLSAVLEAPPEQKSGLPWLALPPALPPGARIAVIGAGVAGCAAARALRRAGFDPLLVDRHGQEGREGSGNPCGLLKPRVTLDGGVHARFYGASFRHMKRLLGDLGEAVAFFPGILTVAREQADEDHLKALAATLPEDIGYWVDAAQAADLTGLYGSRGGLWMPDAGALHPPAVCTALRGDIPLITADVNGLTLVDGGWRLEAEGIAAGLAAGPVFDAVVLAAGAITPLLWPQAELPIRSNRGQITMISDAGDLPAGALSFGGYLSPRAALPGLRVLGATYDRWGDPRRPGWDGTTDADDARNMQVAEDKVPLAVPWAGRPVVASRSSLRATIADHMPVVGPLFDAVRWRQMYDGLHHGWPVSRYPAAEWVPGLYVLGALGSRGFQTAALMAETLAALCAGQPLPLEEDLFAAVSPARFLLREMKQPPQRRARQKQKTGGQG